MSNSTILSLLDKCTKLTQISLGRIRSRTLAHPHSRAIQGPARKHSNNPPALLSTQAPTIRPKLPNPRLRPDPTEDSNRECHCPARRPRKNEPLEAHHLQADQEGTLPCPPQGRKEIRVGGRRHRPLVDGSSERRLRRSPTPAEPVSTCRAAGRRTAATTTETGVPAIVMHAELEREYGLRPTPSNRSA